MSMIYGIYARVAVNFLESCTHMKEQAFNASTIILYISQLKVHHLDWSLKGIEIGLPYEITFSVWLFCFIFMGFFQSAYQEANKEQHREENSGLEEIKKH